MLFFRKRRQESQKTADSERLDLLNRFNKLELRAERFDQEFIGKLINRCNDLESRCEKLRSAVELLDEKTVKFMARTSARAGLKKPLEEDQENGDKPITESQLQELISQGMAVPLGEKKPKPENKRKNNHRPRRMKRKVRARSL